MAKAAEKGSGGNPFDVGLMGNCTDFWTNGRTRKLAHLIRPPPALWIYPEGWSEQFLC